MSNLEHLIENALCDMERRPDKTYEARIKDICNDPNYEGYKDSLSPEEVYEICSYFLYTYCQCCKRRSQ